MIYLVVAIAGALGAVSRFLMDTFIRSLNDSYFPWGTFFVNTSGSFALGMTTALAVHYDFSEIVVIAVSAGFLGAYTTFSGWMVQTLELIESHAWSYAIHNIFSSVIIGTLAAIAGYAVVIFAT
ncbi:MAG: CrcB family protein [Balneolales bacterium]